MNDAMCGCSTAYRCKRCKRVYVYRFDAEACCTKRFIPRAARADGIYDHPDHIEEVDSPDKYSSDFNCGMHFSS